MTTDKEFDPIFPTPISQLKTAQRNGYHEGYIAANKDFVQLCMKYGLNSADSNLSDLVVAACVETANKVDASRIDLDEVQITKSYQKGLADGKAEVRNFYDDDELNELYKRGVEHGREEAEAEHAHRKPTVEGEGFTIKHVGELTVILNNYALPKYEP